MPRSPFSSVLRQARVLFRARVKATEEARRQRGKASKVGASIAAQMQAKPKRRGVVNAERRGMGKKLGLKRRPEEILILRESRKSTNKARNAQAIKKRTAPAFRFGSGNLGGDAVASIGKFFSNLFGGLFG